MPATYDYRTQTYRISCRTCGTSVLSPSRASDAVTETGAPVSDTFRWIRNRYQFHLECRSCEREYRRARRNATGPRTSRTNRAAAMGIARQFGVEFECILPGSVSRSDISYALSAAGLTGWSIKGDGSLHPGRGQQGLEIVSPALSGEAGENAVRTATRVLRGLGATVNRSCGTHVHHDVNDLTVEQIRATAAAWFNNQDVIDGLVSESRRNDNNGYCRRLTSSDMTTIRAISDLAGMRRCYLDRYRTLNLTSYGRHGTIEIRQHQGTLDAEKVISWMRFGQAIIDTAKTVGFVNQHSTVRDLMTALGERMNDTARTFLIGRAVEFGWATV